MLKRLRERHKERLQQTAKLPLDALKNLKIAYIPYNELLKEGFFAGIGWAIGVTVGFVIVSSLIVFILNMLGGLPLIGGIIASIVQATQEQLLKRTLIIPR